MPSSVPAAPARWRCACPPHECHDDRARLPDGQAAQRLYERIDAAILMAIRGVLKGDPGRAFEDVHQEAWIRIFARQHTSAGGKFCHWAFVVARNVAWSWLRRSRPVGPPIEGGDHADPYDSAARRELGQEIEAAISAALDTLRLPHHRTIAAAWVEILQQGGQREIVPGLVARHGGSLANAHRILALFRGLLQAELGRRGLEWKIFADREKTAGRRASGFPEGEDTREGSTTQRPDATTERDH